MNISVKKFKKIEQAELVLKRVNVFIGTNNSGKSSFIQAIQFAISSGQALQLKRANWSREGSRTLALDSTEFLYTPTRFIENLYHGQRLAGSQKKEDRKYIEFSFQEGDDACNIFISRGKNGGFTTRVEGRNLGEKISDIQEPFCVYVPGIAGIPIQEKYEVSIAIKKSATRGDSNNYLRNILLGISKNDERWARFISSLNAIYSGVEVDVFFNDNVSEFIDVAVRQGSHTLPIDSVGTGLLQTIQVFAYLDYFNPSILLLDEPDAHVHPTKQKLLAQELLRRAEESDNLRVVFSTHSRYILEALDENASVIHFQDGRALTEVKGSKILIDIGAADADYLFSKKNLKYIIVTEDKVDDIETKKEFLKKFVLANGLAEDEFVFHSYEGCKRVDFARILKGFVAKQILTVKVILHFDRDQRVDGDIDLINLESDCQERDILLFITDCSEIESYFCQPAHLAETVDVPLEVAADIYYSSLHELEQETKNKVTNFILRDRKQLGFNKNNQPDIRIVNRQVNEWYNEYNEQLTPGKELVGKIKHYLQNVLRVDPQLILQQSSGLVNPRFQALLREKEDNEMLVLAE